MEVIKVKYPDGRKARINESDYDSDFHQKIDSDGKTVKYKTVSDSDYKLVHNGSGWYDILDADGNEVFDRSYRKDEAHAKLKELNDTVNS